MPETEPKAQLVRGMCPPTSTRPPQFFWALVLFASEMLTQWMKNGKSERGGKKKKKRKESQ